MKDLEQLSCKTKTGIIGHFISKHCLGKTILKLYDCTQRYPFAYWYLYDKVVYRALYIQGVPEKCIHFSNNCKRSVVLQFYYFKCVKIFTNDNLLFFLQRFDYILNIFNKMGHFLITIAMLGPSLMSFCQTGGLDKEVSLNTLSVHQTLDH